MYILYNLHTARFGPPQIKFLATLMIIVAACKTNDDRTTSRKALLLIKQTYDEHTEVSEWPERGPGCGYSIRLAIQYTRSMLNHKFPPQVRVTWKPPEENKSHGPIIGHHLGVKVAETNSR